MNDTPPPALDLRTRVRYRRSVTGSLVIRSRWLDGLAIRPGYGPVFKGAVEHLPRPHRLVRSPSPGARRV